MNRNVESHFALNPTRIDLSRSTFDRSSSLKTSFNAGDTLSLWMSGILLTIMISFLPSPLPGSARIRLILIVSLLCNPLCLISFLLIFTSRIAPHGPCRFIVSLDSLTITNCLEGLLEPLLTL